MMKKLFTAFLLFLFPCLLFAQENIETTPYIEVTGNAKIEAIPDIIIIQIALKEYYDGNFKITVLEQEAKMKSMLKITGIDLSKLTPLSSNEDYITITKKEKNLISDKTYILTVSNVPLLTSTFQVLNDLNIKDAKVVSASHSQMETLIANAKTKAIQDAKEKATLMLRAIGNTLGKPLIIRENYHIDENKTKISTSTPFDSNSNIIEDDYMLEIRKMIVESVVYARFAIE
jgi:hypothetical protein